MIQVHDSLAVKVKRGGVGKPVKTAKHGDFYHHDTGKWNHIDQVLDRENDVYIKRIVDGDTGEVIRDDHGRLSDHQGFGDAKRRGDGT